MPPNTPPPEAMTDEAAQRPTFYTGQGAAFQQRVREFRRGLQAGGMAPEVRARFATVAALIEDVGAQTEHNRHRLIDLDAAVGLQIEVLRTQHDRLTARLLGSDDANTRPDDRGEIGHVFDEVRRLRQTIRWSVGVAVGIVGAMAGVVTAVVRILGH